MYKHVDTSRFITSAQARTLNRIVRHQALEALPIVAPAPAPQQAAAAGCGERGAGDGELLLVPAAAAQAPLQPAKLAVWRLHAEQVR
jgi:hypothetical protein